MRSDAIKKGLARAPHRSLLKADGFTDEEMYKAMISKGRLDNRPSLKWRPVKDKL